MNDGWNDKTFKSAVMVFMSLFHTKLELKTEMPLITICAQYLMSGLN